MGCAHLHVITTERQDLTTLRAKEKRCDTARPGRPETPGRASRSRFRPAACRSSNPRDTSAAGWTEDSSVVARRPGEEVGKA